MRWRDFLRFTTLSIVSHRARSLLTALGIAIGISAVVLLTSIGEGIHRFVLDEFTQFGTTIIAINPGKATTFGASIGVFGTVRPLSLDDAEALTRLPYVQEAVPFVWGNAAVEGANRQRRTLVYGTGPGFPDAFQFPIAVGEFLPDDDVRAPRAFAVLGSKMRDELFGSENPLGERIRIGGDRYIVIGVMESKGNMLGFDLDDTVYIPVARGLELFRRDGLLEIDVLYDEDAPVDELVASIERLFVARHGGEDVTISTQDQMLDVLGRVLNVLTFAVAALGGISLLVGAVGIFTIMTIAVRERRSEIGLLRAVGAPQSRILRLFLGESALVAGLGGLLGLLIGLFGIAAIRLAAPGMPIDASLPYIVIAEIVAIAIGLIAGVLPARNAARLDPLEALRAEG